MAKRKTTTLAEALTELRSKEKVKIGSMSEFDMVPVGLSTGNIVLDKLTGIGGLPKGHVIELFGKPSSGKTTTALQAAARLQQSDSGKYVCYWDFERTLDEKYVRALGIDPEDESFVYYQPKSFEDGANKFRKLLVTGEVGLVVFDSVAKMVTQKELDAETGKANVADRAKLMHQYMRQIVDPSYDTGTCVVFLNHVMDLVDPSPIGQKLAAQGIKRQTTPGGQALPFYSSLRMEFKPIGTVRDSHMNVLTGQKEDQIRQTKVQATVVKNKCGDPFGTAELRIRFGKGFSNEFSVFNILRSYSVITPGGQTGSFNMPLDLYPSSGTLPRGEDNFIAKMERDRQWFGQLERVAQDILVENDLDKIDSSGLNEDGVPVEEAQILSVIESEIGDGL